jgi:DNA-binding helix-hairpin-helix protein with protein kinase domain
MPPTALYTSKQQPIPLGALLGRGGEGSVYAVAGDPNKVAKLYHQPDPKKGLKIGVMAKMCTPELLRVSAWPIDTLHPAPGSAFAGVLMPCIRDGREIYCLYSPTQRRQEFPQADWSFLIVAARNLADAFATVHANKCIIGDVNQGNVFVSPRAEVRLIDCDSYQILTSTIRFMCEVGVGHFTPPELQGYAFASVLRRVNHDAFGLAILIFHLLFMGRHPFAGRYSGKGDMPIEDAIKGFRFAFGAQARTRQMSPPPLALALAHVSQPVATLFERAFAPEGAQERGRPTPAEWVAALDQFRGQLKACARYPGHKYFASLTACPWCELERQGATDFFLTLATAAAVGSTFDLAAVWKQIAVYGQMVAPQMPAPPAKTAQAAPWPPAARMGRLAARASWALPVIALIAISNHAMPPGYFWLAVFLTVLFNMLSPHRSVLTTRRQALADLERQLRETEARWQREVGPLVSAHAGKYATLRVAKRDLEGLPAYHQEQKQRLVAERERDQLHHFLERYQIKDGSISGVGKGRAATLASYGIETAADISETRLAPIPGFGPVRTRALMAWRKACEQRFRFDPKKGVDPADLAALQKRVDSKRRDLEATLLVGAKELQQAKSRIDLQAKTTSQELLRIHDRLGQARADLA